MRNSGIGGQAVIEGVMMRNKNQYAVAVRTPDKEIVVEKKEWKSFSEKHKFARVPIIRGVVSFIESMVVGVRTLTFAAGFFEEEEETTKKENVKTAKGTKKKTKQELEKEAKQKEAKEKMTMGLTVFVSFIVAIAIFMLLPYYASNLLAEVVESETLLALIEGALRMIIFVAYVLLISQMDDIKRVFMYHGAEHKSINCIENGLPLTVENAKKQSREHKRCGTSFLLYVMILSVIFFIFIRVDSPLWRVLFRLLLIPVIAGVSYEFIKFAGSSNSKVMAVLSRPGFWLQGLTTREPDEEMLEVAIKSVEAVFDWRAFLAEDGIVVPEEKTEDENEQECVDVKPQNGAKSSSSKSSKKKKKQTASNTDASAMQQSVAEEKPDVKVDSREEKEEQTGEPEKESQTPEAKASSVKEQVKQSSEQKKQKKASNAGAALAEEQEEQSVEQKKENQTSEAKAGSAKEQAEQSVEQRKENKASEAKADSQKEAGKTQKNDIADESKTKPSEKDSKSDEQKAEEKEASATKEDSDVETAFEPEEEPVVVHRARVLRTGVRGHGGRRKRTLQEELNQLSLREPAAMPERRLNQEEFEGEEEDEFLSALDHFFEDKHE